MKKKLPKMLVLPLFLGAVTLSAAGLITGVHFLTEDRIARNIFAKQNEGYYKILALEAGAAIDIVELDLHEELEDAGVTSKKDFRLNNASIGVVYDAEIRGYAAGLKFQVGFKEGNYAGFNVVASNETPTYGGVLLDQVDELIKGKPADTDILLPTNVTTGKTVTASALTKALKKCAADYLRGGEAPEPELDPYYFILDIDAAAEVTIVDVATTLDLGATNTVNFKREYFVDEVSYGIIYDVTIKGYKEGLNFQVGFHDLKYAGFKALNHAETPGIGEALLDQVHDLIKGLDATAEVLIPEDIMPEVTVGVTVTRNAVNAALSACAADYLAGRE
ncbi:MAG TPA: FMN-binding protein [Bacilli bacterium]|nr:FMN-binding protein [Bacilli bacterium]